MRRGRLFAAVYGVVALGPILAAQAQLQPQTEQPPQLEETPTANVAEQLGATRTVPLAEAPPSASSEPPAQASRQRPKEKLARIWANEPPLVRLARDKFGAEFTETDAKFFAAVAANGWADFRPSADTKYNAEEPSSWAQSQVLKADRIAWLCSEASASRLVPSRGIWLRGVQVDGKIDLYRCTVPFSLTFYDCLLDNGLNIRNAKLQELDISNSCTARIDARGVQVAENVYLLKTAVFGGLDFIEAQVAGDLDIDGGVVFHGMSAEDIEKPGVAINLYDAKIDGDVKLGANFRALGRVRLTGARIGRSLACNNGRFSGIGELAIDAERIEVRRSVTFGSGFRAQGGIDIRHARIGGDLNCDGGNFIAGIVAAINGDLCEIDGQLYLGDGLHVEGEVRFINAVVGKDVNCTNGHFINPGGVALRFDSTVIGRSLWLGYDASCPTDSDTNLPPGFFAQGTVTLYGTQVGQDLFANGGEFNMYEGTAIVACNLRVGSRVVLSNVKINGCLDLSGADIEHELDLRGSQIDGRKAFNGVAIWAPGMKVRGDLYCSQIVGQDQVWPFRVQGQASFPFATIGMHWDLDGAQLINPGSVALDASDCRVGGYVNLNQVAIEGRASFSRAKIDGMWILNRMIHPERMILDMRFAHIWVIKDERLDDWPPAGQLQLEGFVYDHFDDDSPLSVDDRLAWLRRQYAPLTAEHEADAPAAPNDQSASPDATDAAAAVKSAGPASTQLARSGATLNPQIIPVDFQVAPSMPPPQMSMPAPMSAPPQEPPAPPSSVPAPSMVEPPSESAAPMPPPEGTVPILPLAEVDSAAPEDDVETVNDNQKTALAANSARLQPVLDPTGRRYITQPYTQLASVYRAIGQDEQANAVLVARGERLGELSPAFSAHGLWYRYIGRLIGYGYEPFRAIKMGVVIVLVGTVVFAIGAHRNLMAETKLAEHVLSQENESRLVSPTYPRFNPFIYSLDVFLPFADLSQECYWIPGERVTKPRTSRNCLMHIGPYSLKWSGVLRTYLWFQTLAGWTLCTLLAAAVTGIVQS